jgi:hypothetical protein
VLIHRKRRGGGAAVMVLPFGSSTRVVAVRTWRFGSVVTTSRLKNGRLISIATVASAKLLEFCADLLPSVGQGEFMQGQLFQDRQGVGQMFKSVADRVWSAQLLAYVPRQLINHSHGITARRCARLMAVRRSLSAQRSEQMPRFGRAAEFGRQSGELPLKRAGNAQGGTQV